MIGFSVVVAFRRRKAETIARIRRDLALGREFVWVDSHWYDVLTRDEVQALFAEYGYGELRKTVGGLGAPVKRDPRAR